MAKLVNIGNAFGETGTDHWVDPTNIAMVRGSPGAPCSISLKTVVQGEQGSLKLAKTTNEITEIINAG